MQQAPHFFKAARGRAGSLPHNRLARGPRGAGEGERRRLQRRLHFSFFYVLWRFVECYWPRTPPTEGVAYLGQFIACRGIAVTRALRKQKERAVYFSDDSECRPVTRILCGGVLTRPKWTKLPKYIFYCRSVYKQCGIVKKVHIGFSYNIVMTSGDDDKRRRET